MRTNLTIEPTESVGDFACRVFRTEGCSIREAHAEARKQCLLRDIDMLTVDNLDALRSVLRRLAAGV
jgi:hypothetical protein